MRIVLQNLKPASNYYLELQGVSGEGVSPWSRKFTLATPAYSTLPATPTGVTWEPVEDTFQAEWNAVTTNVAGATVPIVRYEIELVDAGMTKYVSVTPQTSSGAKVSYNLSFAANASLFGTARDSLSMRVRAVDNLDVKGAWSASILATHGIPDPPTNAVVEELNEAIKVSWTPPVNMASIAGYRVYVGLTAGFTPSLANRIYQGESNTFTYATGTFSLHYFKIRSYSRFSGLESVDLLAQGTPVSPYGPDTVPPSVPTGLAVTTDRTGSVAKANLTWAFNAATPGNEDIQAFVIKWYKSGEPTKYSLEYTDKTSRTLSIQLPQAYSDYVFQIASVDYLANYSAYSTTVTLSNSVPGPPAAVTGLTATTGMDSLSLTWVASASGDVVNGGFYKVTIATNAGFTTGVLNYETGNTNLTVSGLVSNVTYYYRVIATDSTALDSTAVTGSALTDSFPLTPLSDGSAPASSPTPVVVGGIGYLHVSWPAITNNDMVTYEVHLSATTGFTPAVGTKAAEQTGTSVVIENVPGGGALAYGTTYYVKIIAKDRDGAAAAGTQASGTPIRGTISDLTLVPVDIGAPTIVQAQGYANTAETNAISTAATDAQTKATTALNSANSYTDTRETAITTAYNSAITTSANGKNKITHSLNVPGTAANTAGDTWFRYNASDQVIGQWRGMGGTTWVSETIESTVIANLNVAKLVTGTMDAAVVTINSTGQIKSQDYVANTTGWSLSNGGLQINNGIVDAKVLKANTSFTNNLFVASTIQIGTASTTGYIQSYGYSAGVQGFSLSKTGLVIEGAGNTIAAAAINVGKLQASQIETSQIVVGQSQVTNLGTDLSARPLATTVNGQIATAQTAAQTAAVSELKTLWGHPSNTTLIDGGDIYANTVKVSSIAVADFTNYVPDPYFTSGGNYLLPGTLYPHTDTTNVPQTNVPRTNVFQLSSAYDLFATGDGDGFPVSNGDQFYVEFWVAHRGAETNTLGTRIWCSTSPTNIAGDTATTGWSYPGFSVASDGTVSGGTNITGGTAQDRWIKVSGNITIPANPYVGLNAPHRTGWAAFGTGGPTGGNGWQITGWTVRKRNGGELIVDGSVAANKMTAGTYTGGEFIIGAGGILKTAGSEVTLTSSGITVTGVGSSINAASLTTGSTITADLGVTGNMTISSSGTIKSTNYSTVGAGAGFSLGAAGLDIRSGTIAVGTLISGTISSQTITLGAGGAMVVDSTAVIRSNNWNGTSTGWQLSSTGLTVYGLNARLDASNIDGDTITGRNLIVSSGGSISSYDYNTTNKTGWSIYGGGFTMYNGTIQGPTVRTDQLYSIATGGTSNGYKFSVINGYAEFEGAKIWGNATVGSGTSNFLQSGIYTPGSQGWKIDGNGNAYFHSATITGTVTGSSFNTASSGERIEMSSSSGQKVWIKFINNFAGEWLPTGITSSTSGIPGIWTSNSAGSTQTMQLAPPGYSSYTGSIPKIGLDTNSSGGGGIGLKAPAGNILLEGVGIYMVGPTSVTGSFGVTALADVQSLEVDTNALVRGNLTVSGTVNAPGTFKAGSRTSASIATGAGNTQAVTFGTAFSSAPTVVATAIGGVAGNISVSVSGITASGFNINYWRYGGATGTIDANWFAYL